MQTSKALDRHKTKVGRQRKAADKLLREVIKLENSPIPARILWDTLVAEAKDIYNET